MDEKVSIIIPVYKVEKYLNRCVASVINQTYKNIEIVLVDDGSPDNCPQMCEEWANKDDRVRVIHKENAGLGMARNSGIKIATGDYLMFVDSDDYLSENAVSVLYERLIEDESDFAVGKHVDVHEDGRQDDSYCYTMTNKTIDVDELCELMGRENFPVAAWGKIYKRKLFSAMSYPTLRCGEDMWTFVSILEASKRVSVVDENVYFYLQRGNSITHEKTTVAKLDEIDANLYLAQFFLKKNAKEAAKKWFARAIEFSFAVKVENLEDVRKLLCKHFGRKQRMAIYMEQKLTIQIKWMLLYMPPIYKLVTKKVRSRSV